MITKIIFNNNNVEYFNLNNLNSLNYLHTNNLGSYAPFQKSFIIRGIGFKANLLEFNKDLIFGITKKKILSIRVGHSFHLVKPIPNGLSIKISKKDRKLVIYGNQKNLMSNFAQMIFNLRPPSVYTGRGIRVKKIKYKRKLGKKGTDTKTGRS